MLYGDGGEASYMFGSPQPPRSTMADMHQAVLLSGAVKAFFELDEVGQVQNQNVRTVHRYTIPWLVLEPNHECVISSRYYQSQLNRQPASHLHM